MNTHLVLWVFVTATQKIFLDYLPLVANGAWVHKFNGMIAKKETSFFTGYYPRAQHKGNMQTHPFPNFLLKEIVFAYLKNCCLGVWLLISLNVGAKIFLFGILDTSWYTINYWEPLKIMWTAWTIKGLTNKS